MLPGPRREKTFNCINRSEGDDHIVCAWPKFHCTELRAKSWPSEVSGANPFLPCLGFCPRWFIWFMEGRCIVRHSIWNYWKEKLRPENGLLEPMRVQKKKKALTKWCFSSINGLLFEVRLWNGKSLSTKYFSEMKMRATRFKIRHMGIKPLFPGMLEWSGPLCTSTHWLAHPVIT